MEKILPAVREIKRRIAKQKILFSPEAQLVYASDVTKERRLPAVVVFPENTNDIIALAEIARKHGIQLTARGAGTGMSGGAVPNVDGIVISLARMNKIIDIDPDARTALVEPGVITAHVQDEVLKHGLFYPPDPSSYKVCTIGGNIAENAGGLRCVKYGVTSDYIAGLEIVDQNAEIVTTGCLYDAPSTIDLTPVFCGSEGMLGIITKAALKLLPAPKSLLTMSVQFPSPVLAAEAVTAILNAGILPCILEFIDSQTLKAVSNSFRTALSPRTNALLLIEFDEGEEDNLRLAEGTEKICNDFKAISVISAGNTVDRDSLWDLRRSISPSLTSLASGKINEDVSVPRGKIAALIEFVAGLSRDLNIPIPVYGHAGDGNLHVNFMYDRKNPDETRIAHEGVNTLLREVIRLKGTISGEHGIGLSKQPYLPLQLSPENIALHQEIRSLFDKHNIYNSDKMLPL